MDNKKAKTDYAAKTKVLDEMQNSFLMNINKITKSNDRFRISGMSSVVGNINSATTKIDDADTKIGNGVSTFGDMLGDIGDTMLNTANNAATQIDDGFTQLGGTFDSLASTLLSIAYSDSSEENGGNILKNSMNVRKPYILGKPCDEHDSSTENSLVNHNEPNVRSTKIVNTFREGEMGGNGMSEGNQPLTNSNPFEQDEQDVSLNCNDLTTDTSKNLTPSKERLQENIIAPLSKKLTEAIEKIEENDTLNDEEKKKAITDKKKRCHREKMTATKNYIKFQFSWLEKFFALFVKLFNSFSGYQKEFNKKYQNYEDAFAVRADIESHKSFREKVAFNTLMDCKVEELKEARKEMSE